MAIDTKSISQLITEFRKLQTKDSITPESLGYILQRLADLLATAGTSETIDAIQKLLDGFKTAATAVTSIAQGKSDRNHVYAKIGAVSLINGSTSSSEPLFIQQATTERAGAMRAQQVTDLNAARKGVTELQSKAAEIEAALLQLQKSLGVGDGSSLTNVINTAQISCEVVNGRLKIHGAQKLTDAGYVPYLFRLTRKRNPYHHRPNYRIEGDEDRRYCQPKKGWHVYGSRHAVSLSGESLAFSLNSRYALHRPCEEGYSENAEALVHIHVRKDGLRSIAWGRSNIKLNDIRVTGKKKDRMLRLPFAIGFAKPMNHGKMPITPANLVSSLAMFSVIYDPTTETWYFGK